MVPEAQVAATLLVSSFGSELINLLIRSSVSTHSLQSTKARLQGLMREQFEEDLSYNDITIKLIMNNLDFLG